MKSGLGRRVFFVGFFHKLTVGQNLNPLPANKTFCYGNVTLPPFNHLSLPLHALTKIFVKAPLLKTEEQAICTVRRHVPTAFPLIISKTVNQRAESPFKEAFSSQDALLMSVAALGILIATQMRHINNVCLPRAAFMAYSFQNIRGCLVETTYRHTKWTTNTVSGFEINIHLRWHRTPEVAKCSVAGNAWVMPALQAGEEAAKLPSFNLPISSSASTEDTAALTSASNALATYQSPRCCVFIYPHVSSSLQRVVGEVKSLSTGLIRVPCGDNSYVNIVNYFIFSCERREGG